MRILGLDNGGFLTYVDLGGLAGEELDALIARQREHLHPAGRTGRVEAARPRRARRPGRAAGRRRASRRRNSETVVVGPVAPLAAALPVLPDGVRLREVSARADLDRIAAMESAVWSEDRGWLADGLAKEVAADPAVDHDRGRPRPVTRWSAPAGSGSSRAPASPRCGAAPRCRTGGARGIYRALVAYRARLAQARGLHAVAGRRVRRQPADPPAPGVRALTTTTPYVYTP